MLARGTQKPKPSFYNVGKDDKGEKKDKKNKKG